MLEVLGQVTNQGSTATKYTKVVGSFYNESGRVIYVGFTFTDPD